MSPLRAAAQDVPLSERGVVQQTIAQNPTLHAAISDLQQSAASLRVEEARYRPRLLVDASGAHQNVPNVDFLGGTTTLRSQTLNVVAEVNQTFSWGSTLAFRLENQNSRIEGPLYTGSTEIFKLGPSHLLGARLTLTQPLLRGFGNDVGLASLRTASLNRREQERARDATASQVLSAALQAYWELWYTQRALTIEREARDLAALQRDETARKVSAGSMAEVDLLTFETRLAQLEQSVLDAQVAVLSRSVELRKALGVTAATAFDVSSAEPPELAAIDHKTTLAAAEESSYNVAQLKLALERSATTLRSAADATRARLDVSAWLQAQGLGNQSLSGALEQLGGLENVSGNVGVTFELPFSSQQHDAQLASARLAVTAARDRLVAAIQQIRADTETELTTLAQARDKITLAERTADISRRSAEAQQKRLQNGTALTLEVREAEDAHRRAKLSIERQRVDATKARIRLAQLTGHLLIEWGITLGATSARDR
ncbi:MAG: TolC family protein [Polyangiales bacterium]